MNRTSFTTRAAQGRAHPGSVRRSFRRGFTLIELLVVIAILSLLLSLLIPSLREAMEQARRAVCLQQMRQLPTFSQMYASEYNGYVLFAQNNLAPMSGKYKSWLHYITIGPTPYVSGYKSGTWAPGATGYGILKPRPNDLFSCPSDKPSVTTPGFGWWARYATYQMNENIPGHISIPIDVNKDGHGNMIDVDLGGFKLNRLDNIKDISNRLFWTEKDGAAQIGDNCSFHTSYWESNGLIPYLKAQHSRGKYINAAFLDSSARSLDFEQVKKDLRDAGKTGPQTLHMWKNPAK